MLGDSEWLKKLKIGDKVIIPNRYGISRIEIVSRFTKTLIITGGKGKETKYRKSNGAALNNPGFGRDYIYEPTPEALEERENERLKTHHIAIIHQFTSAGLHKASSVKLKKIVDLIKEKD